MNRQIMYAETPEQFWDTAMNYLLSSIIKALNANNECCIGLSGGSTPRKLYEMLAKEKIQWDKIKIVVIDERYVPADNDESNLKMIRDSLLMKTNIPAENIYMFDTSLLWHEAADKMDKNIRLLEEKRKPVFDILILGAGEKDGHVASLFNGEPALESTKHADTAFAKGYKTEKRLTLTMSALTSSAGAMLLLYGNKKKSVVEAINNRGKTKPMPVLTLLKNIDIKIFVYLH